MQNVQADSGNGQITWILPGTGYTYSITLYAKNMSELGYQNISVVVYKIDIGTGVWTLVTNASVNGTMLWPNTTVDYNFNFTNHSNGSYSYWYNFSINGSFFIDVDIGEPSVGNATINDTIVVGRIINNFTISPSSVPKNQWCTFAVTVCNFGSFQLTNVTTTLTIYNSSGSFKEAQNLTDNSIFSAGDCQTLTTQIMFLGAAYPVGQYVGQINVTFNDTSASDVIQYYANVTSENQSFNITAATTPPTTPPTGGFGGGGGARRISESVRKTGVDFKKYVILRETRPGEEIIVETILRNLTNKTKKISAIISGVPPEWLSLNQQKQELGPHSDGIIKVLLDIPEHNVEYGDYFVIARITSGGFSTETFFVLRVKYYPEDYEFPEVFRNIDTNFIENKTFVEIDVHNPKNRYKYVEIVEDIPKSLAQHVNEISFGTSPTEVLVADPKVSWMMLDFEGNEERKIEYEAAFATEEYEPYVYWPVEQVNVLYPGVPEKIKISQVHIDVLIPGMENNASFLITNTYPMKMDIKLSFDLPYGWKASPSQMSFSIDAQSSTPISFLITPRPDIKDGTYSASIIIRHNFGTVSKSVPLIVGGTGIAYIDITGLFFLALPWIGLILFLICLVYVAKTRYKKTIVRSALKSERRETLNNIRDLVFKKK